MVPHVRDLIDLQTDKLISADLDLVDLTLSHLDADQEDLIHHMIPLSFFLQELIINSNFDHYSFVPLQDNPLYGQLMIEKWIEQQVSMCH